MRNKRYKNSKSGTLRLVIIPLSIALIVLFTGSALNGWNDTLVKKIDLVENYSNNNEINQRYTPKADFNVVDERTKTIANQYSRLDEKIDLILMHYNITYKDSHNCPYPPCKYPKKKKKKNAFANKGD